MKYETVIWEEGYCSDKSQSVYSDTLIQCDKDKFSKCYKETWGSEEGCFDSKSPSKVNEFLNKYFGKEVRLTVISKMYNASNGMPFWRFIYEE